MEIRVLKYFVESARNKSITKAALKLNVTQPTLSRQLKELEEELGQKLFKRSNYHINLTVEGEILYKRAIDILNMVDKTETEFKALQKFNGGDLHIGCAETIGIKIIARIISKIRKNYPNIKFHLHSGNFFTIEEKLNKNIIDFAIVVQNIDTSSYNYINLKHNDIWGILMKRNDKLSKKEKIVLNDIFNLPLIISRQGFSDEMPNEIKEMKDKLNIVGTYDLIYNASIFVEEGLGYALCLDKLIKTNNDNDLIFKPIFPEISSPLKIIWQQNQILSKTSEIFLNELKKI